MTKCRVLVVDDSALIRKILTDILNDDPEIEVIGAAADPYIAREKIKKLNPDVLTLDVEMPRMDGVTFLGHLMRLRPMPVVMVSSLTEKGAEVTLQALELGAVDFVAKPKLDVAHTLEDYAAEITGKVKAAAKARVLPLPAQALTASRKRTADAVLAPSTARARFKSTDKIIAIGASTGGTEAIKSLLAALPPDMPGIVITQHIPAYFSKAFAQRVDGLSALNVVEAGDGQQILRGHAYVAPGNRHLLVDRDGARYICRLNDGPPVNRHRPSVDVLFRSVAQSAASNSLGVILTGMGDDGAKGLKEMHEAGSRTAVQDEKTSVVWGMPGAAVKHGGVDEVLALGDIAPWLVAAIE